MYIMLQKKGLFFWVTHGGTRENGEGLRMERNLSDIGNYKELGLGNNCGSIKDYIQQKADYDKRKVVIYLKTRGKRIASCSYAGVDCVSGEKLSHNLSFYSDGEYCWNNTLWHHVEKYNVVLPKALIQKAEV